MPSGAVGGGSFRRYVLYVDKSRSGSGEWCPGSAAALKEVEAAHLKEDVVVQSVSALLQKGVPLPSWLDGTPILVDTSTNEALKGSAAVRKIKESGKKPPSLSSLSSMQLVGDGEEEQEEQEEDSLGVTPGADISSQPSGKVTANDLEKYMKQRGQ